MFQSSEVMFPAPSFHASKLRRHVRAEEADIFSRGRRTFSRNRSTRGARPEQLASGLVVVQVCGRDRVLFLTLWNPSGSCQIL